VYKRRHLRSRSRGDVDVGHITSQISAVVATTYSPEVVAVGPPLQRTLSVKAQYDTVWYKAVVALRVGVFRDG
jgi:hypothetical protein